MAISSLNEEEFVKILKSALSIRSPIRTIERLIGREKELELIHEALHDDGGHIFIYGDRGVGKSSLAASVAAQYQSSDNDPIQIPCGKNTRFYKTVEEIAERILRRSGAKRPTSIDHTLNLKIYKVTVKERDIEVSLPQIDSMFSAVDVLEEVVKLHSSLPVIVIDEFDQIECPKERADFAHFIKDLGDRGVNVKFIFTGIASSLYQLLGDHESSFRQLFTLNLERLYWTHREEISYNAINKFGLEVEPEIIHSIARLSNGFPYFVHLLTQNLLWSAFKEEEEVKKLQFHHFEDAVNRSIVGVSGRLQRPYELAVLHDTHDHLLALWATADSESFIRYFDNIFNSYLRINAELFGKNPEPENRPLDKKAFKKIINKFKSKKYGEILELVEGREGIFSYKENLLRGYVALKAIESGIELKGDEPDEPKIPTAMAKAKFSGKYGKMSAYPSDPAKFVKFRHERDEEDA